jgi:hypothetical protein
MTGITGGAFTASTASDNNRKKAFSLLKDSSFSNKDSIVMTYHSSL